MAIRVKSIAFLLALVGCTLISTVAVSATENNPEDSTKTEIETLKIDIEKLKDKPKEVEEKLKNYGRPSDQIGVYTVRMLVELCQESLDKCSYYELNYIPSVATDYKLSCSYMRPYVNHCRDKINKFCVKNIETVTENLLKTVTEDEKNMAKPFWESVRSSGVMERAHQNAIAFGGNYLDYPSEIRAGEHDSWEREEIRTEVDEAYLEYQKEKCGTNPSVDDLELFFFHFLRSMERYFKIYRLYVEIQGGDQSAPNLKDGNVIDLFKFARIAGMFHVNLSGKYFKEFEKKMTNEYGCKYNLGLQRFMTQTEEKLLERREILKDHKANNININFGSLKDCFDLYQ